MGTFRKTAREAVIFMLLGPVVAVLVSFVFLEKRSISNIKAEAAQSVFAIDAAQEPVGFRPVNSALVPLTNGGKLYVTDCNQAHPSDWVDAILQPNKTMPVPPGSHGGDCVYFSDPYQKQAQQAGGQLSAVPLGGENQVAIEKD
jgi:hypothetical protein